MQPRERDRDLGVIYTSFWRTIFRSSSSRFQTGMSSFNSFSSSNSSSSSSSSKRFSLLQQTYMRSVVVLAAIKLPRTAPPTNKQAPYFPMLDSDMSRDQPASC
eukprot:TRINITY_DN43864_c0_g1_i1.p3 TRINITY_DN43864_c0_g1~~TRINITY_DN43864_c0_g1_i1.p3  ORF type:complete len:103 (-),score=5.77 TRINITY_DN43864_c0_g1_i1:123-431(-)